MSHFKIEQNLVGSALPIISQKFAINQMNDTIEYQQLSLEINPPQFSINLIWFAKSISFDTSTEQSLQKA